MSPCSTSNAECPESTSNSRPRCPRGVALRRWSHSRICLEQLLGLSLQLNDVGGYCASRESAVCPVNGRDELLSKAVPTAQPCAPVVRSPEQEKSSPDDDRTDVGVDAVLSADVDSAPMSQGQYTGSIHAPSACRRGPPRPMSPGGFSGNGTG